MNSISTLLCALLVVAVSAQKRPKTADPTGKLIRKGPCEQTLECARKTFDDPDKNALCLGLYSCFRATVDTEKAICTGAAACVGAKMKSPESIICNGFRACNKVQAVAAEQKVTCGGAFACNDNHRITAKQIKCDGDNACIDSRNGDALLMGEDIMCNGNKACSGATIKATTSLDCDGDLACSGAIVTSSSMRCNGKAVCSGATIRARNLDVYGKYGAGRASIYPGKRGTTTINAYGFRSLVDANIDASGDFILNAYGYLATKRATMDCRFGAAPGKCYINCYDWGCRGFTVLSTNPNQELEISPAACADPAYIGKRYEGTYCPTITTEPRAEHKLYAKDEEELDAEENMDDAQWLDALESEVDAKLDSYRADFADVQVTDKALETIDQYLDQTGNQETAELVVNGNLQVASSFRNTAASALVMSNLITAVCTFAVFVVASYCFTCRTTKGEITPLLQ